MKECPNHECKSISLSLSLSHTHTHTHTHAYLQCLMHWSVLGHGFILGKWFIFGFVQGLIPHMVGLESFGQTYFCCYFSWKIITSQIFFLFFSFNFFLDCNDIGRTRCGWRIDQIHGKNRSWYACGSFGKTIFSPTSRGYA